MPAALRDLDYDQYRDIRFRPEKALWHGDKLPFEVMFFHQGRAVPEPVRINVVEPHGEHVVPFDPALFDYGRNKLDPASLRDLGFNGFRVHFAINRPGYKDEVLVFQGASYFRALGKGQGYGLSARGLAVDTAAAKARSFRASSSSGSSGRGRPRRRSSSTRLLDSKRIAGAYRFVLTPGVETTMQVTARLYPRERIAKLGLAPLTSMFAFGENQPGPRRLSPGGARFRRAVDAKAPNGEWIWRPLVNPKRLLVTSFAMTDPRGFGLMQRDRAPASYEDPEAQYERRPSAWVEPIGYLGQRPGRTGADSDARRDQRQHRRLLGARHAVDAPGRPFDFAYRHALADAGHPARRQGLGGADAARSRLHAQAPTATSTSSSTSTGRRLRALAAGRRARARHLGRRQRRDPRAQPVPQSVTGAWRMTLRVKRLDAAKPVELRALPQATAGDAHRDLELHRAGRIGQAVTAERHSAHPRPASARSMRALPWAGAPLSAAVASPGRPAAPRPAPRAPPSSAAVADAAPSALRWPWSCSAPGSAPHAMAEVLPAHGRTLEELGLLAAVRRPVRLDLRRLLDRRHGRLFVLLARTWPQRRSCACARGCRRAPLDPARTHGDRHADLQRGRADRLRRPRGDLRFAAPRPANRRTSTSTC